MLRTCYAPAAQSVAMAVRVSVSMLIMMTVPVRVAVPMSMVLTMITLRVIAGRALVTVGVPAAPARKLTAAFSARGRAMIVAGECTGRNRDRPRVHDWLPTVHQQVERRGEQASRLGTVTRTGDGLGALAEGARQLE